MYFQWGKGARSGVRKSPGLQKSGTGQLHPSLSCRHGTKHESAQGVGQQDELLEPPKLQLFAAGRRVLRDCHVPEQTCFLQPFSRSGVTEKRSRIGSGSPSAGGRPGSSAATTASRGSAGHFAPCC